MNPDVVIFDLDGCISDDRHRRGLLPRVPEHHENTEEDYEAYHAKAHLDTKLVAFSEFVSVCKVPGMIPLVVTARPESERERTWDWLRQAAGDLDMSRVHLLMRPHGDRTHSPLLKPSLIHEWAAFRNWQMRFIGAYDDREDVLRAYVATGIVSERQCWLVRENHIARLDVTYDNLVDAALQAATTEARPATVPEIMRAMADTYEERNAVYGDNFKNVGGVMAAMFPNGVVLRTPEEFVRWHLFELKVVKLTRFAQSGLTHVDSIHDDSVYGGMIEHVLQHNAAPIKGVPNE